MYNRYKFFKKIFKDTMVLMISRNKLIYMDVDYLLKEYKNINYIVVDNLDIIKYVCYENNQYSIYLKRSIIKMLLNKKIKDDITLF